MWIQRWRLLAVVLVEMMMIRLVVVWRPGATAVTTLSHANHPPIATTRQPWFRTTGPIITVTIPHDLAAAMLRDDDTTLDENEEEEEEEDTKQRFPFWYHLQRTKRSCQSIWDTTLSLIQPSSCFYTIQTMPGQLPLPQWCPALTSCAARWGYHVVTTPTTNNRHTSSSTGSSSSSPFHTLSSPSNHHHHHRYSMEGLTKLEWNPKWCPVVQVAIQPHCEWTTSTSSRKKLIGTATKPTSSSSSVLFHTQTGNSNFAWLRLSTTTSSLPTSTVSFEPLSKFENDPTLTTTATTTEIAPRTTDHIATNGIDRQHHDQSPNDVSEYQRTDEAAIRASRFIPLPLATWSSCSITPTIRWIRRSPGQQQMSTDASCDVTLTSGGSGRTTATVTLAPWSPTNRNLALAMEYRLSGGFRDWCRWFRPALPPWRTRNAGMTLTTPAEQPQHWIRQIWEWHPRRGSVQNHSPSLSGIVASQYQWLTIWPSGQSIRTVFDPPSEWNHADGGLSVTWTDPTNHWNRDPDDKEGTWITHLQIRLTRHRPTRQSWLAQNFHAADVQVRRRFRF